jgi:transposase-like protein
MVMDAKAPTVRNIDTLAYWFDAWNADNERARSAYEALLDSQESEARHSVDPPAICHRRLHAIRTMNDVIRSSGGKWWCAKCREDYQRRRSGLPSPSALNRLTPEKDAQIRARYEAGESALIIAADYGVSDVTVLKAVRRAGGQIRTFQQARAAFEARRSQAA